MTFWFCQRLIFNQMFAFTWTFSCWSHWKMEPSYFNYSFCYSLITAFAKNAWPGLILATLKIINRQPNQLFGTSRKPNAVEFLSLPKINIWIFEPTDRKWPHRLWLIVKFRLILSSYILFTCEWLPLKLICPSARASTTVAFVSQSDTKEDEV